MFFICVNLFLLIYQFFYQFYEFKFLFTNLIIKLFSLQEMITSLKSDILIKSQSLFKVVFS